MKETLDAGRHIRLISGKYVDLFSDFDTGLITIEDIAHSLSFLCRFNGQIIQFYSVAQHSIWVANHCPPEHRLTALLHDASEAMCADIPSPLKNELADYKKLEDHVMTKLAEKFGFQYPFPEIVKIVDRLALEYEWETFVIFQSGTKWMPDVKDFKSVKADFLKLFYELKK